MYTPKKLFFIRLQHSWQEQWKVWRTAIDWTVWLYFIVPGLLFLGGSYMDAWQKLPLWAIAIPPAYTLPALLLVWMLIGTLRVFVTEADRLFLLQNKHWISQIKVYGTCYTLLVSTLTTTLLLSLILPVLVVHNGLKVSQIIWLLIFVVISRLIISQTATLYSKNWRRPLRWLFSIGQAILLIALASIVSLLLQQLLNTAMLVLILCAVTTTSLLLIWLIVKHSLNFDTLIKQEKSARLKSTELLMSQAMEVKRPTRSKRPWFFSRSQRLFRKEDAAVLLAEQRIKAFIRESGVLRIWLSFIGVTIGGILQPMPLWVSSVLLVFALFVTGSWLNSHWKKWIEEDFIKQLGFSDQAKRHAYLLSLCLLLLPPLCLWLIAFTIKILLIG